MTMSLFYADRDDVLAYLRSEAQPAQLEPLDDTDDADELDDVDADAILAKQQKLASALERIEQQIEQQIAALQSLKKRK
jgi:hypothetical protein